MKIVAAAAGLLLATGCATKKGFEVPGFAFGCPVGDTKVSSMEDLVRAKTVVEGRRSTVQATEMRCSKSGDLIRIDANLNNDSRSVKRVAYKFRPRRHARGRRGAVEAAHALRRSNLLVNTVSPNNKAVDFRLILRSEE